MCIIIIIIIVVVVIFVSVYEAQTVCERGGCNSGEEAQCVGGRGATVVRRNRQYIYEREGCYWAIQRSWFARVNALCNLSRKKSREVAAHFRADF